MTPDELDAAEERAAAVDAEYDRGGGGGWGTVHESQSDVPALIAALREAWADNDRLGAMVEWQAEVIVDARDACQRAESIEPSGSPEWVESGIAMRTTALREVRTILDRERNAHPFGLSTRSAVAGNGEFAERAEKQSALLERLWGRASRAMRQRDEAEAAIARVRALCDEAEADLNSKHVCGPDCHCDCLAPKDVRAALGGGDE